MNSSIKQGVLILLGEEHTHNNHDKDAFEVVFVSARVLSICTKSLCIQQYRDHCIDADGGSVLPIFENLFFCGQLGKRQKLNPPLFMLCNDVQP
jgi:hypothetical protein